MNQFFYTRIEGEKTYRDSFHIDAVIRSVQLEDDKVLVLLSDLHERTQQVPEIDIKTNKLKGYRRERNTYQSEITLSKEDGERFYKLLNIEDGI
jgi:hypothetical protein